MLSAGGVGVGRAALAVVVVGAAVGVGVVVGAITLIPRGREVVGLACHGSSQATGLRGWVG